MAAAMRLRVSVGGPRHRSMIIAMRRLLHSALGVWFLIVMTMAQGCAGPALTASNRAPDPTSAASANGGSSGQIAGATGTQSSNRSGARANTSGYVADPGASSTLTE